MDNRTMSVTEMEQGWNVLKNAITRIKNVLESWGENISLVELLYTLVDRMCKQEPRHDYTNLLFHVYMDAFEDYINSKVLPSLRAKHGEDMLKEFVKRWDNHKFMVEFLSFIFNSLNQPLFLRQSHMTGIDDMGMLLFLALVYAEMKVGFKDAVLAMIHREREGNQIHQELVKNVLEVFVEIGMESYENDFETFMLEDSVAYYRKKALSWTSRSTFMKKTHECLEREKERVDHYLHASSKEKLLEKVQEELLSHYKKLHERCVLG